MHKVLLIALVGYLSIAVVKGQNKEKTVSILPVPAFGYTPETRTYVGAVALYTIDLYKDSLTRTSNAKVEFNYTWNKQIIAETEWTYFFSKEKWLTKGLIHFSKFPDRYYGAGSTTYESDEWLYQSNRIIVDAFMAKKIRRYLFAGHVIKYTKYSDIGSNHPYSELRDNTSIGAGVNILYDSRNNLLQPKNGWYLYLAGNHNLHQLTYTKYQVDARHYYTWHNKYTVAARFYQELNTNTPPFYDYALLGGDKLVRGFYYGRFRDQNLSTLQTEVRSMIKWRLGLAAFGGLSSLYKLPEGILPTLNTTTV